MLLAAVLSQAEINATLWSPQHMTDAWLLDKLRHIKKIAKERSLPTVTRKTRCLGYNDSKTGAEKLRVDTPLGHGSHASCDIDVYKQRSMHSSGCHGTSSAQNSEQFCTRA